MRAPEADHIMHLCSRLADRGLDVHVLTTKGSVRTDGLPFKVYPLMRDWSWSDLLRLAAFLKRCAPDAIFLYYVGWIYKDHPMITLAPTVSKTILPTVPFVTQFTSVAGAPPNQCSFLTRLLRKVVVLWASAKDIDYEFGTLLRDSDQIIVMSDSHRAALAKLFAAVNEKNVLIPPPPIMYMCPDNNGIARKRGRKAVGLKTDDFVLVYLGYLYPSKGVEYLLRAFENVRRKKNNVALLLVGGIIARKFSGLPDYAHQLYELCQQLKIDNRVRWTGEYPWDSDEGSIYLRAADLCVLPFDDGVNLNNSSFAAATVHGLPVVTTQGKFLDKPLVHQENVYLCPPKNPEALGTAIVTLMDRPEIRERLRIGGLELAREWYSWDKAIDRTIATLSSRCADEENP